MLIITTIDHVTSALCVCLCVTNQCLWWGARSWSALLCPSLGCWQRPHLQPHLLPAHQRSLIHRPELGRFSLTCSNFNIVYVFVSAIRCYWTKLVLLLYFFLLLLNWMALVNRGRKKPCVFSTRTRELFLTHHIRYCYSLLAVTLFLVICKYLPQLPCTPAHPLCTGTPCI